MGFVFSAIAYVIVTAGAAIAGAAIAVGSAIAAAVSAAVAAMATVVSGISSAVGGVVSAIQNVVGSAIQTAIKAIGDTIITVGKAIDTVTAPILSPIKSALTVIHDMTVSVQAYVKTVLAPVQGIIDVATKISELLMIANLIRNLNNINDLMSLLARQGFLSTAAAIAQLYLSIVTTARDTVNLVHETQKAFDAKVVHLDERIRESNRLALEQIDGIVKETVIRYTARLEGRTDFTERRIEEFRMRTEDLPFFAGMMIRVLE